jgi:hypothetical protein
MLLGRMHAELGWSTTALHVALGVLSSKGSSHLHRNMHADLNGDKPKTRNDSAAENKVVFQDTSEEVVMLLNHAYGGTRFQVDSPNLYPCLKMAWKYDMPRLLDACHDYLDTLDLVDSNATGWLREAPSYKLPRFTKRCVEYAAGHLQSIIANRWCYDSTWQQRFAKALGCQIEANAVEPGTISHQLFCTFASRSYRRKLICMI